MSKRAIWLIAAVLLASGCQQQEKNMDSPNVLHTDFSNESKQSIEAAAEKKLTQSFSQITDVVAVEGEEHLLVAYQIAHFDRFRSKKLEKKIQQSLEQEFPMHTVVSSGDLKIFWETEKLAQKEKALSEKKMEKKILKLKTLKEEQT